MRVNYSKLASYQKVNFQYGIYVSIENSVYGILVLSIYSKKKKPFTIYRKVLNFSRWNLFQV